MKSSFWCVIGLVGLLALGSFAEAAEWVYYSKSDNETCYYDASSIRRTSKDLVRVWMKIETSPGYQIESNKQNRMPTEGYEKFSHSLMLFEINCSTMTTRTMTLTDYSNDGKTLFSNEFGENSSWITIRPESNGEELYQQVCKQKGKR
jgi:hypothetical protein